MYGPNEYEDCKPSLPACGLPMRRNANKRIITMKDNDKTIMLLAAYGFLRIHE